MSYDRETIAAYVDGELDLVTAGRIEAAMADLRTLRDETQRLIAGLDDEPGRDAPEADPDKG